MKRFREASAGVRVTLVVLLLALSFPVIALAGEGDEAKAKRFIHAVSLIRLIADPEKYDGKRVGVRGFLRLEFEGNAVYLHREDYENSLTSNAVGIVVPDLKEIEQFDRRYVALIGIFNRCDETRSSCYFSGVISAIDTILLWPQLQPIPYGQGMWEKEDSRKRQHRATEPK